ncbi:MAG: hypothetical protein QOD88_879 [Mycobacterium sp.]|jgi:hypothetical protein|nr:hypothetical protein [Mycobacterium sp.]MDT5318357.1 hypothetical protein [Mycobacterium sp.]
MFNSVERLGHDRDGNGGMEGRSRNLEKDWDRNYVHSLDWRWLTKPLNDARESPGSNRRPTWSTARR